jgi:hypothetical protein
MTRILAVLLFALALRAQTSVQDPKLLLRDVQIAIGNRDLVEAYDSASKLDDSIQAHLRALMTRDLRQRVDEVLGWMPATTESVIVGQEPFVIETNSLRPEVAYLLNRVPVLNDGAIFNALRGRTVRIAAVGASEFHERPAAGGVTAFYVFTGNLMPDFLGAPEQDVLGRPVWRAAAGREGQMFLTLGRPNLLVIASTRDLITDALIRIVKRSLPAALSAAMPEWSEIDRASGFWAFRHIPDNRDPATSGLTVNFDIARMILDVRVLSSSNRMAASVERIASREFQVDRTRLGVLQLKSNLRERGPSPFGAAMALLGFGSYQ